MRLSVAGVQVEGTPQELGLLLRAFVDHQEIEVSDPTRPVCANCGKTFANRDSLSHHVKRLHGQQDPSGEKDPTKLENPTKLEKLVLSRLYRKPERDADIPMKAKTVVQLSREVDLDNKRVPQILAGLSNRGLIEEVPNPFDRSSPFYFRSSE